MLATAQELGIYILWIPVFRGFAGTGMYWWWDTFVEPRNMWFHYKGIAEFLKGEDLTVLSPVNISTNDLGVSTLALQNKERALVWLRNNKYDAKVAYDASTTLTDRRCSRIRQKWMPILTSHPPSQP